MTQSAVVAIPALSRPRWPALDWAQTRLSGTPATRQTQAEAAVARIDGLLMFRQLMAADAADRAAHQFSGEPSPPGTRSQTPR